MAAPWTEGRLKAFIIAALRSATRRYPPKYECLNEAKTEKKINPKTKRLAQFYRCNACGMDFTSKDVQVDHIIPVVDPRDGFKTWDDYINRLFCDKSNLQVLCTTCHQLKTSQEKKLSTSTKQSKPRKARTSSKASSRKKNTTS